MSEYAGFPIYIGVWINYGAANRLLGSTLTLSTSNGGLLSAFLAIFISLAGLAFWRILSFVLHQIRAKTVNQDGFHHQQQLIFRNTSSASGAFWQMLQLPYYWRKNARSAWMRTLPLALLALTNVVIFAIAAIFSSEVTKAPGKGVLIRSADCGSLEYDTDYDAFSNFRAALSTVLLNDTTEASAYTRNCYGSNADRLRCNRYVQRKIPWETNVNASCPFADDLCFFGKNGAMKMDTGPIDSRHALGINFPKADRITYRRVATCSPLRTPPKYRTVWNETDPQYLTYGDTYDRFLFGPISDSGNYTYQYNRHSVAEGFAYTLRSISTVGPWSPVPALLQTNSYVTLFFLAANALTYGAPVSDPFFSANIPRIMPNPGNEATNTTTYESDDYVNVLGCIDQHQYCNPNNNKCTALIGSGSAIDAILALNVSNKQLAIAARIASQQSVLGMYYSVNGRGSGALRASESVFELSQVGLPNDQWMNEVSSWFAISLAKVQEIPIRWAIGPSYVPVGSKLKRASLPEEIQLCKSQIILSPGGTTSFSVLGIVVIFIVGIFLMLLSLFLDSLTGHFRSKLHKHDYKQVQWGLDGIFQLHRLAYEAAGQGTWTGGFNSIPVTRQGDLIRVPDFRTDSIHPTLRMREQREDSEQVCDQITTFLSSDQSPGGFEDKKGPFFSYAPVSSSEAAT